MKVSSFTPVVLTITLENEREIDGFAALLNTRAVQMALNDRTGRDFIELADELRRLSPNCGVLATGLNSCLRRRSL